MQTRKVRLPWQLYTVFAEFPVEDILPKTKITPDEQGKDRQPFEVNGLTFYPKMYSLRYITFRKSLSCVSCGITGSIMRLEMTKGSSEELPHFNLYARNSNGHLVLMTKDHIYPKSKGGKDHPDNLQTMCENCNGKKKDTIPKQYLENIPHHLLRATAL